MTRKLSISIPAGPIGLEGMLELPADQIGVVLFAHGSGSSRFSGRNRAVAHALQDEGFATLLLDLLTPEEEARDVAVHDWTVDLEALRDRPSFSMD